MRILGMAAVAARLARGICADAAYATNCLCDRSDYALCLCDWRFESLQTGHSGEINPGTLTSQRVNAGHILIRTALATRGPSIRPTLRSRHWNYLTRKIRKRHRRAPTASTQTRQSPELRRRAIQMFLDCRRTATEFGGQRDTERRQTRRCHARIWRQYLFRIRSVSDRDPPPARPFPLGNAELPETGRSLLLREIRFLMLCKRACQCQAAVNPDAK